jgi:hypothetical protein
MLVFSSCARRRGLRLVDLDAGLLDERRRDDEEDQQDEDAVDHRRHVDAAFAAAFVRTVAETSHGLKSR